MAPLPHQLYSLPTPQQARQVVAGLTGRSPESLDLDERMACYTIAGGRLLPGDAEDETSTQFYSITERDGHLFCRVKAHAKDYHAKPVKLT